MNKTLTYGLGAALLTLSPPLAAQTLERAPYLQMASPTSMTIVWTTTGPTDSVVRYGPAPNMLNQTAQLAAQVTQHEVKINGLSPDTTYYYEVGATGAPLAGADAAHYFKTSPPAGQKKKFRAWVLGDSGTGNQNQAAVRDAMIAHTGLYKPHLFLHMGDIAYTSGTTAQFTNYFFGAYPTILQSTPVWPTLGNHEGQSSDSATQTGTYYTAYVLPAAGEIGGVPSGTEAYYSFDYANVHFVVLNSQDVSRAPNGPMLTWLAADLAATSQDWIIAYWHHPAYTKGTHNSDTEGQLVEMRENALPILEAAGVDLVLAGHSHIYERSFLIDGAYATPTTAQGHIKDPGDGKPLGSGPYKKSTGQTAHEGAVYVVAGHGGASTGGAGNHPVMYFSEVAHGSCLLDVQDNRVALLNVRADGAVTDRFAMMKGNGLMVAAPDGTEVLQKGMSFDLRWVTVGNIPNVTISLSTNDGKSWSAIASNVPNTGTYTWTVPAVDTNTALIKVANAQNALIFDESNAGFAIQATAPQIVIPFGSTWRYHDQGVDQGSAWLDASFDDGGWSSGPAQLGYGDGDEATVMFEATHYPSYYFRKVITLGGPVTQADLKVLHDDGVAVWVNGALVFSKYTDNGLDFAAFASATSADNEVDNAPIPLAPSPFVVGDNVVAAMVKQASLASSDVSFDLELTLTVASPMGTGGAGGMGAGGMGAGGMGASGPAGTGGSGAMGGGGPGAGGTGGSGGAGSGGGCGSCATSSEEGGSAALLVAGSLLLLYRGRARRRRRASC